MIPAHFICRNHFYSFLSVQTRVQETRRSGPPESRRTLSRRNHFSSFLPGEQRPGSHEIRLAGMHCTVFRGNQFSSFLPARTAALEAKRSGSPGCTALFFKGTSFPRSFRLGPQPWKPRDRARWDALHYFSREPLFLVHGRLWPASRLSSKVLPLALRCEEIAKFWQ